MKIYLCRFYRQEKKYQEYRWGLNEADVRVQLDKERTTLLSLKTISRPILNKEESLKLFNSMRLLAENAYPLQDVVSIILSKQLALRQKRVLLLLKQYLESGADPGRFPFSLCFSLPAGAAALLGAGSFGINLDEILGSTLSLLKIENEFGKKNRNRLIYPVFLLLTGLIILMGSFFYLIPELTRHFSFSQSLKSSLTPLIFPLLALLPLLILGGIKITSLFSTSAADLLEICLMKVSVIRDWLLARDLFFWFYTAGKMVQTGIEIPGVATHCTRYCSRISLKNHLEKRLPSLEEGFTLADIFREYPYISQEMIFRLDCLQETGNPAARLLEIAEDQKNLFLYLQEKGDALAGPVISLYTGFFILSLAISLMTPFLKVMENLL